MSRLPNPAKTLGDLPPGARIRLHQFNWVQDDGSPMFGSGEGWTNDDGTPWTGRRGSIFVEILDAHGASLASVSAERYPRGYEIADASAVHGWGPLAYDILMERATDLYTGLAAGDTSKEAQQVWAAYLRRPDVAAEYKPTRERDGSVVLRSFEAGNYVLRKQPKLLLELAKMPNVSYLGDWHRPGARRGNPVERTAADHAAALVRALASVPGAPSGRAWSKPGVGARVYFAGGQYVMVGRDGTVSTTDRGRAVFLDAHLPRSQRLPYREAMKRYIAEHREYIASVWDAYDQGDESASPTMSKQSPRKHNPAQRRATTPPVATHHHIWSCPDGPGHIVGWLRAHYESEDAKDVLRAAGGWKSAASSMYAGGWPTQRDMVADWDLGWYRVENPDGGAPLYVIAGSGVENVFAPRGVDADDLVRWADAWEAEEDSERNNESALPAMTKPSPRTHNPAQRAGELVATLHADGSLYVDGKRIGTMGDEVFSGKRKGRDGSGEPALGRVRLLHDGSTYYGDLGKGPWPRRLVLQDATLAGAWEVTPTKTTAKGLSMAEENRLHTAHLAAREQPLAWAAWEIKRKPRANGVRDTTKSALRKGGYLTDGPRRRVRGDDGLPGGWVDTVVLTKKGEQLAGTWSAAKSNALAKQWSDEDAAFWASVRGSKPAAAPRLPQATPNTVMKTAPRVAVRFDGTVAAADAVVWAAASRPDKETAVVLDVPAKVLRSYGTALAKTLRLRCFASEDALTKAWGKKGPEPLDGVVVVLPGEPATFISRRTDAGPHKGLVGVGVAPTESFRGTVRPPPQAAISAQLAKKPGLTDKELLAAVKKTKATSFEKALSEAVILSGAFPPELIPLEKTARAANPVDLHDRIESALGWKRGESRSLSLASLRDLVRPVDPGLAQEISMQIQGGAHVTRRGNPARPNKKLLEDAVRAAQFYAGADGLPIKTQARMYERMMAKINKISTVTGMSPTAVSEQISAEASRRGRITPQPGKDY